MVLRIIFRYLANNEYLVNKLSDSKLFRRTAQLTVYIYHRTKAAKNQITWQLSSDPKQFSQQLNNIIKNFSNNLRKEIEKAKENLKK